MRSLSKNSRRLRVEQLEDRCVPGSVLDLVGDPLLAPLGQSLVFLEATANLSHTSSPQETAAKVDSALCGPAVTAGALCGPAVTAGAQTVRVNSSKPAVIDGAVLATGALA